MARGGTTAACTEGRLSRPQPSKYLVDGCRRVGRGRRTDRGEAVPAELPAWDVCAVGGCAATSASVLALFAAWMRETSSERMPSRRWRSTSCESC